MYFIVIIMNFLFPIFLTLNINTQFLLNTHLSFFYILSIIDLTSQLIVFAYIRVLIYLFILIKFELIIYHILLAFQPT